MRGGALAPRQAWVSRVMPATRSRGGGRRREAWVAFGFLAPAIAGFLVFVLGPALAAIGLSFYDYDVLTSPRFVGLANYAQFAPGRAAACIYLNTLVYVGWYVSATTVLGVLLAVAAHRPMLGPGGISSERPTSFRC